MQQLVHDNISPCFEFATFTQTPEIMAKGPVLTCSGTSKCIFLNPSSFKNQCWLLYTQQYPVVVTSCHVPCRDLIPAAWLPGVDYQHMLSSFNMPDMALNSLGYFIYELDRRQLFLTCLEPLILNCTKQKKATKSKYKCLLHVYCVTLI